MKLHGASLTVSLLLSLRFIIANEVSINSPNGPECGGKTLHKWLSFYDAGVQAGGALQAHPAVACLRQLCPGEVPLLLHWIERKGGNPQTRQFAVHGFQFAGTNAAIAIPRLIKLLGEKGSRSSSAARALGSLGAKAMPHLVALLDSDSYLMRRNALLAITSSDANELPPQTLYRVGEMICDENEEVQFAVCEAIEKWKSHKQFFIPGIKKRLTTGSLPPKCREVLERIVPEHFPAY